MSKLVECARFQNGYGGSIRMNIQSNVAIITMDRGENRMNDEFIDQMNAALDEALSDLDVKAIVTTGQSRFYCNGLDLSWLTQVSNKAPEYVPTFLLKWHKLQQRLLTCPVPTVAAINGHAFAGGGVMSLCHDYRVMQTQRGFWCLNEVQLGLNFPMWIIILCRIKLSCRSLLDAVTYGKRFPAEDAVRSGIVDVACQQSELLSSALALVNAVVPSDSLSREFVQTTKTNLFEDILNTEIEQSSLVTKVGSKL